MSGADSVAHTVNTWIGNPLSRGMLKLVSGRCEYGNRLDLALRSYTGEEVKTDLRGKLSKKVVEFVINKGSQSFGLNGQMEEYLKDPIVRRGIVNILEGIAKWGVRRPQTTAAPFLVVWDYTKKCNLKCKHCYESASHDYDPNELNTEEAKGVIDQFAEAGVVAIAFSGGEPLIRPDFFELVNYASKKGFYVTVASNGTLITEEKALQLKEAGVKYIEISLDGFEETHDKFRGIPGVWKLTCRGIKNCVKAGIDTCVATTVTKYNLDQVPRLIEFVEKDLGAHKMIFFNFIPTRRGCDIVKSDLSPKEREALLRYLYEKLLDKNCKLDVFSTAPQYAKIACEYAKGPILPTHFTNKEAMELLSGRTGTLTEFIGGCGAGRLYCALEPNGDVMPCVFIPVILGNIRDKSLREIWQDSEFLEKMRDRDKYLDGCGTCKHKYICGGCRARAYSYFGDPRAPDPGCRENQRFWDQIVNEGERVKEGELKKEEETVKASRELPEDFIEKRAENF